MNNHLDVQHDPEADALYIRISDQPYAYGKDVDRERRIDYAADDTPIGIELLCVSQGVDVTSLPRAEEIERVLKQRSIRIFA